MRFDRDELLARTDLAGLADELLGWHVGNGRNARWPSPVRDHPQTGRTPPMSTFVDHRGIERWTCFATGAHGTAIDLVMTATGRNVGETMTWLAERARLDRPPHERPPLPRRRPTEPSREPSESLRAYVEACERLLWRSEGESVRRWLVEERRLDADVLRVNRVGADPGCAVLRRAKGLPRQGSAAVFPVLGEDREPVYLQARYLEPPPDRGKYDNPASWHGRNPRLAFMYPTGGGSSTTMLVTEGAPDALAAATIGYRAAAILGSGLPDRRVAERLAGQEGLVVLAFDADAAGRTGAVRMAHHLRECGHHEFVSIEPPLADLNTWLVERGPAAMKRQVELATKLSSLGRTIPPAGRSIA